VDVQSCANVASANGARHVRSLTMRRPDAPWGAAGDKRPRILSARWLQPPCVQAPRKSQGAILGGNLGMKGAQSPAERSEQEQRISCRWKAPRTGENHTVSRRWGGSGLGGSCRIGDHTREREKARTGIRQGLRQGCQRYDRRCAWVRRKRPHVARAIRRSDVERRETLSSPVSMGGIPSRHARRRVGDDEPGRDGVRVLVV
jgi:hypothetical protein